MRRFFQCTTQALRERLLMPLRQLTWAEVLVAVSVGVLGGTFPVPLVTSLVTLIIGYYVRCTTAELVLGSTANLFCTPLQFALLPSFARFVGSLTEEDVTAFTAHALQESLRVGYATFLSSCGRMIFYATIGWFLVSTPIVLVLRFAQQCIGHRQSQKEMTK
ncbi:hypothetical_protein [Leishmania braziliensis MHOM/BR/75/M2904]|uniref:Hypothetical_protein n=1 Tax=Leishmania braziliensis MHOM/BR/75/M2904 TaxID=420245 RepID=A0A3P3Z8V6_LEIBR|nr:hypothetical protein MNV84_04607 [Leishmania braziliensis]CAJ2474494.1 unnamed protein product [Leishmania braziliensis]SYZ66683.1 hypothetical_protein [Leishmania braziliensis MHOM/BR/75/M2904]